MGPGKEKGRPGRGGTESRLVGRRGAPAWARTAVVPCAIFPGPGRERTNPIAALTVTAKLAGPIREPCLQIAARTGAQKLPAFVFASRRGEDYRPARPAPRSVRPQEKQTRSGCPARMHLVSDHQHRQVVLGRQLADDTRHLAPSPQDRAARRNLRSKSISAAASPALRAIANAPAAGPHDSAGPDSCRALSARTEPSRAGSSARARAYCRLRSPARRPAASMQFLGAPSMCGKRLNVNSHANLAANAAAGGARRPGRACARSMCVSAFAAEPR